MSCEASVKAKSCPVSSLGRKPFGIDSKSQAVTSVMPKNTAMQTFGNASVARSVIS